MAGLPIVTGRLLDSWLVEETAPTADGTSEPSMRHVNETLWSLQQSIEGLARQYQSVATDVEELKKGKSSATMEQRVGDNLGGFNSTHHQRPFDNVSNYGYHDMPIQNSHPFHEGGYQGRPQVRGGRREVVSKKNLQKLQKVSLYRGEKYKKTKLKLEQNTRKSSLFWINRPLPAYPTADGKARPTVVEDIARTAESRFYPIITGSSIKGGDLEKDLDPILQSKEDSHHP
ncbi:hypothetical protein M9H77_08469 [Catharanthus roseus]|uniref:Uncharacterized protein n=1 Tax=Catharanthus roseus TaxID=4058 RepID=A0ACC0BY56_CATRO|nr:hypothetical protein M9H77_08469 [Catharanthus roseus]